MTSRRDRLFEKWNDNRKRIEATVDQLQSARIPASNAVLRKHLGIEPWDRKLFVEWLKQRTFVPPVTEKMRQATAIHESGHAVIAELLIPGSVERADCFRGMQILKDDGRVAQEMVGKPSRGGVRYNEELLRAIDTNVFPWAALYRITIALAAPTVELLAQVTSKEELATGMQGDCHVVDLMCRALSTDDTFEEVRKNVTSMSVTILGRLLGCEVVKKVLDEVSATLLRDTSISGEQIRSRIVAHVGPIEDLLKSLNIPVWNDPARQSVRVLKLEPPTRPPVPTDANNSTGQISSALVAA